MQATVGDHLIVHGHKVGDTERRGEVLEIRGPGGAPPYIVRWDGDGHEGLFFPGPDAEVEATKAAAKAAKTPKTTKAAKAGKSARKH
jgi:hypothetical protein